MHELLSPVKLGMVGRDAELRRLLGRWQSLCRDGALGVAMLLRGAAGIGKSRLGAALRAQRGLAFELQRQRFLQTDLGRGVGEPHQFLWCAACATRWAWRRGSRPPNRSSVCGIGSGRRPGRRTTRWPCCPACWA